MKVTEIFASLQGEGKFMGFPTTFVRVYGCPFNCKYCDTEYAKKEYRKMSIERVLREVSKNGLRKVCITGGEPLLDEDTYPLIYELLSLSYEVTVETSGLVPVEECTYNRSYAYCMDVKCPCSGMEGKNIYANLSKLKTYDEVKFVVADSKDLDFVKKTLKKYPTKAQIIISPLDNNMEVCKLITDFILKERLNAKLGIQLHRYLNIK